MHHPSASDDSAVYVEQREPPVKPAVGRAGSGREAGSHDVQLPVGAGDAQQTAAACFDCDAIFSAPVVSAMTFFGIQPARTAWKSPWQNGVGERWIGSVRREQLLTTSSFSRSVNCDGG